MAGSLAEDADTRLLHVREMPPLPHRWPLFPAVPVDGQLRVDPESVDGAAKAAITAAAPEGWRELVLECRAAARWLEISATTTVADGEVRAWSPPAVVSQWLRRKRMRD